MTRCVHSARRTLRAVAVVGLSTGPALLAAQSAGDDPSRLQAKNGRTYSASVSRSSAVEPASGAPASITIEGGARRMLVGATVPHSARVRDAAGVEQRDVAVRWTSSDPNVASVNQFGVLTAVRPGPVAIRVAAGGL